MHTFNRKICQSECEFFTEEWVKQLVWQGLAACLQSHSMINKLLTYQKKDWGPNVNPAGTNDSLMFYNRQMSSFIIKQFGEKIKSYYLCWSCWKKGFNVPLKILITFM